jgi:hypothetical protein
MTENLPHNPAEVSSSEKLDESVYGDEVKRLIEIAPHFNQNQLARMISEGFIKDITESARAGELTIGVTNEISGEKETVVLTPEDMFLGQFDVALIEQDTQPENPHAWEVNIPRANGLRYAAMALMQDKRLSGPFRRAVYTEQARLKEAEAGVQSSSVADANPELIKGIPEHLLRTEAQEDMAEIATEQTVAPIAIEAQVAANLIGADRQEQEVDPLDRFKKLYPPILRPPAPKYEPTGQFGQYIPDDPEGTKRRYYDKFVTQKNREAAVDVLTVAASVNPEIRDIILANNEGMGTAGVKAVDLVRENPDVRAAIAKVLADKLEDIVKYPNNLGRLINFPPAGYRKADAIVGGKYTTNEYAVLMALKMLGGEFSEANVGIDKIEFTDGVASQGQHRHAALTLLRGPQ